MPDAKSKTTIEIAARLGFLDEKQVKAIEAESADSNYPLKEVAIRRGFLNREHLRILQAFAEPTDVVPGYRIDGLIGRGGVGVVYKATQIRMRRPVAIKTINQSLGTNEVASKRFEREAQIIGQLRHPNIISAFDFGLHGDQLFLVMEFVEGIDAEKHLLEVETIPELLAWEIALQICHALDCANQSDIIHRDIKPGNLILTSAPPGSRVPAEVPFVKIADFGLARFKDQSTNAAITMEPAVSGTPFYMSPEQVSALEIDHRSDIYSLGITLWHLITGCPPIVGNGPLEVISNKMKLEDSWFSEASDGITPRGLLLLKEMCRHDRAERISDYSKLIKEIESVISVLRSEANSESDDFELGPSDFTAAAKITSVDDLNDFNDSSIKQPPAKTQHLRSSQTSADGQKSDFKQEHNQKDSQDNQPTSQPSRFPITATLAGVAALLMLGLATYFFKQPTSDPNDGGSSAAVADETSEPRNRLIFSGRPIPLFRGKSLEPTQKSVGTWEPAKDLEGGQVMAGGTGWRNFKCFDSDGQPLDLFRFTCGFQHHQSEEIQFRWLDPEQETMFVAIFTHEQSSLSLADGSVIASFDFKHTDAKYHTFQIESQPDHWRIMVGATLLGEIPKPETYQGLSTIQLAVAGEGQAFFEAIEFRLARDQ